MAAVVAGGSFAAGRVTVDAPRVGFVADEPGYVVVAGAVRPDEDCEWQLIDDDAHTPVGIEAVATDADTGTFTVEYAEAGSEVVTFVTSPDETLAAAGVEVGASVSPDRAVLRTSPFDCATIGGYANVWVYGLIRR